MRSKILRLVVVAIFALSAEGQKSQEVIAANEKVEVEVIAVTPHGLYPTNIVRPPGPFILYIENRSGLKGALRFSVETESKALAKAIDMDEKKLDGGEVLRLPTGKYTLSLIGKSKFTLTLEVLSK